MDDSARLRLPASLPGIITRTEVLGFSMPSVPRTGSMLRVLCASKPGGRLLELGTGTGLATAWMLDGMDATSTLTSVDIDPEVQAVARAFLGDDPRLEIVTEDAATFLQHTKPESFDLIFADAIKGKYELLDAALVLLRPGGLYIIDDMLPQENWPPGHSSKVPALLVDLATRPGLQTVSLAWSSGLLIAARTGRCRTGR